MFAANFLQQKARGGGAHLPEGLADGGEAGDEAGGDGYVVEANDGDVCRDMQAAFVEGANGAKGGDVVEANYRGEVPMAHKQLLDAGVAELRMTFQADGVAFGHGHLEQAGHANKSAPAAARVRA